MLKPEEISREDVQEKVCNEDSADEVENATVTKPTTTNASERDSENDESKGVDVQVELSIAISEHASAITLVVKDNAFFGDVLQALLEDTDWC